jgi:hypothetical protein
MKVLLISANRLTAPYPVYPIGLDHVARAIAGRHEVRIADVNSGGLERCLPSAIREFAPDVIGLSLRNVDNTDHTDPKGFVGYYRRCIDVVRHHSRAPLVVGGSGFTLFPVEMMQALGANYGIIGEGERMASFLEALEQGRDPERLPGVVGPNGGGDLPTPWPQPFGSLFSETGGHLGYYLERGAILNLQTKRGCPFRCIYCTYPHIEGHRLRLIPPDEVALSALRLERAGARFIFMTDSAFNADYAHSAAVGRAMRAAGVSIPWGAFFSPTRAPAGYFRELADCGLTHVEFGTESLADSVLAAYKKPFRSAHVIDAHQAAIDAGLYVAHYFLLGGPGENKITLSETLSRVDNLPRCVLFFFCGMRIYPNTALYKLALDGGKISHGQSLLAPVFYHPDAIRFEEIDAMVRKHSRGRPNWIIGAGGDETADIVARMYRRGFSGPLWEFLIR